MKVTVKYGEKIKEFNNKANIIISSNEVSDFIIPEFESDIMIKLSYLSKYNNYVVLNVNGTRDLFFENKIFKKVFALNEFQLTSDKLPNPIEFLIELPTSLSAIKTKQSENNEPDNTKKTVFECSQFDNMTDSAIEKYRVAISKEMESKITELKAQIRFASQSKVLLNISVILMSVASSFGLVNYLFGFSMNISDGILKLTTNAGILAGFVILTFAISMLMSFGVYLYFENKYTKKIKDSVGQVLIGSAAIFMIIIYTINLLYFNIIPNFSFQAMLISLLFVGGLTTSAAGCGYFRFKNQVYRKLLTDFEYREDFESVIKRYRNYINNSINNLSENKINFVKNNLINLQMKRIIELTTGILTAPFLAYGVSNTLAECFPEAASWIRISGLRFSPIFLILATFMIIFAFFAFVRAFTITKQMNASETIKFDGFFDYHNQGVTIFGLDLMQNLEKERRTTMYIACAIIFIEIIMNVFYFVSEFGGNLQGMFLSFTSALVPTALLIAETYLMSVTEFKINCYNDLLAALD